MGHHIIGFDSTDNVIFNNNAADIDFNIKGDTDGSLLYINAGTNKIGIGTNAPDEKLHVIGNGQFRGTVDGYSGIHPSGLEYRMGGTFFVNASDISKSASSSEQSVQSITVPANSIGTGDRIEVELRGQLDIGASGLGTWRIYWNSTKIFEEVGMGGADGIICKLMFIRRGTDLYAEMVYISEGGGSGAEAIQVDINELSSQTYTSSNTIELRIFDTNGTYTHKYTSATYYPSI